MAGTATEFGAAGGLIATMAEVDTQWWAVGLLLASVTVATVWLVTRARPPRTRAAMLSS